MPPELEFHPPARPGNLGGETYRQYCGLPGPRIAWGKRREDAGPVTAQRLYAAIRRRSRCSR